MRATKHAAPQPCRRRGLGTGVPVRGRRRLPRTDCNYFLSADGTGCGGALRITDIYGEQLTADGIAVRIPGLGAARLRPHC
ncbi:hypothetical protein [Streptomyces sp. NPDC001135]